MRGRVRAWIVACALLGAASPASAQIPVTDGLNFSQNLLTQLNTLLVTVQQAEDLVNQVNQLRTQGQLLQRALADGTAVSPATFAQFQGDIAQLYQIIQRGEAITVGSRQSLDRFAEIFPGDQVPAGYETYRQQSRSTLDTLAGVLEGLNVSREQVPQLQARLNQLRSQNAAPQGQLEAIQTGNALMSMVAEQQIRMQQALALQTNALTVAMAQQVQRQESEAAADRQYGDMGGSPEFNSNRNFLELPRP
jgi:P-type conjugative transfer protein TrbJ